MSLANVALTNTFDEWRVRTNQLVSEINDINSNSNIKLVSNSSSLVVSLGATRKSNIYVDLVVSTSTSDTSSINLASALSVNSVSNLVSLAFNAANNAVTDYSPAYIQANTARDVANLAFNAANSGLAVSSAYDTANASYDTANSAYNAANNASLTVYEDNINAARYITFSDASSGSVSKLNVSSTKLSFNPNTGTLSATIFNSLSDENKKYNIKVIEDAILKTQELRGVQFNWKDNGNPSAGILAQDLNKVLPELVSPEMTINYSGVIGLLVQAVKELNERVRELEK